jgi:hypothetical protein
MQAILISWFELIDKITILQINELRKKSPDAHDNIRKELYFLQKFKLTIC